MPKLILKSGYTKDTAHIMNYITYVGEKLEAQNIIYNDGSVQSLEPDRAIDFSDYSNVKTVQIITKDGRTLYFNPDTYKRMTDTEQQVEHETIVVTSKGEELPFTPAEYISYIGNRPHVVKDDIGGIFDINGSVSTDKALETAESLDGHIWWTHILSVTREDGQRTGYDCRESWESLVRSKAPKIAELYNISLENLVMFAAYHDKELNPHVHLFVTSKTRTEGFVRGGVKAMNHVSEKMRSTFFNQIFKDDVSYLKEQKNDYEHALAQEVQLRLKEVSHKNYVPDKSIAIRYSLVAEAVKKETGRKFYGYMSADTKSKINSLLRSMVRHDKNVSKVYEQYMSTQRQFVKQYVDEESKIQDKMDELEDRFFSPKKNDDTSLHNAIIKVILQEQKQLENRAVKKETVPAVKQAVDSSGISEKLRNEFMDLDIRVSQGDKSAYYKYAKCLLNGQGCEKDIDKAVIYFDKAVDISPYAAYTLFKIYRENDDFKDNKLSMFYLNKAATLFSIDIEETHNVFSHFYLGEIQSFYNALSSEDMKNHLVSRGFSAEEIEDYVRGKSWVDYAEAVRHYYWSESPKAKDRLASMANDSNIITALEAIKDNNESAANALLVLEIYDEYYPDTAVKKEIRFESNSESKVYSDSAAESKTNSAINNKPEYNNPNRNYSINFALCRVIGALAGMAAQMPGDTYQDYEPHQQNGSKIDRKRHRLQSKNKDPQQVDSNKYMSW